MPSAVSAGATWSRKTSACRWESALGLLPDHLEDLARHLPRGARTASPVGDPALEAGHSHHEELVEVAGEDRQEAGPFEERQVGVLRELEDAPVEAEPGELTVEEPVGVDADGVEVGLLRDVRRGVGLDGVRAVQPRDVRRFGKLLLGHGTSVAPTGERRVPVAGRCPRVDRREPPCPRRVPPPPCCDVGAVPGAPAGRRPAGRCSTGRRWPPTYRCCCGCRRSPDRATSRSRSPPCAPTCCARRRSSAASRPSARSATSRSPASRHATTCRARPRPRIPVPSWSSSTAAGSSRATSTPTTRRADCSPRGPGCRSSR